MVGALKTGDSVTADSLEEAGTRTRLLKGTLEIIKVPAYAPYPAFTAFFVDGQEANVATIRLDETLVAAFNPQQPRDENGQWAEQGSEQFKPGTTEGTIVALLEGTMKGGKYGQGAKTLDETMDFIKTLRETGAKSGSNAEKEWVAAIDKVTPVWFKEKDAARKVEEAYKSAVENPSAPEQLFNPKFAAEVKARQTELAENQIVSKEFVKAHPEYMLEHGNEGTEFGWLLHSDTGEQLTQKELAYQARKWTAENETRAEQILARSDVYVRLEPPSLTRMLEDGRMRTFHEEQGQENSISNHEGGNTPEQRRRIEEAYFGKGTYPVYGYLSDDPHGFLDLAHSHPLASVEASLGFYGDIAVKLRPEVRARTTYTLGDSSALAGDRPVVVPQPLEHPTSLAGAHFADLHNSTTIREATLNNFGKVSYFESQIHGGVKLSDIDEITFTYTPPKQIQKSLKDLGVKWRALEKDPEQGYSAEEYGLTAGALWRERQAARVALSNECHDPATGEFCTTAGAIESHKLTATLSKKLNKELDAEGYPKDQNIRGVFSHVGEQLAVARDPQGKILGGIAYNVYRKQNVSTHDFRVLDEKKGTGTKIMQHLAEIALTTKDKSINLYGALSSAVPFYQKMGAEFHREKTSSVGEASWRWSSNGDIEGEQLKALAAGHPQDRRLDLNDDTKFNQYGQPLGGYMAVQGDETYADFKRKLNEATADTVLLADTNVTAGAHPLTELDYLISKKQEVLFTTLISRFSNDCHDDIGRFCAKDWGVWEKATKTASKTIDSTQPGESRYWLTKEGTFVPVERHMSVVPKALYDPQSGDKTYQNFSKETGAIRIEVLQRSKTFKPPLGPEIAVDMWNQPATDKQVKQIASQLRSATVRVIATRATTGDDDPSDRMKVFIHKTPTEPGLEATLEDANRFLRGHGKGGMVRTEYNLNDEPPPTIYQRVGIDEDSLTASILAEFSNTCHDPDSGEFCETPGAPGHEDHQGKPSYGTPSSQSMKDEEEAAGDEYRGGHQPPRYSVTIDDLTNARGSADDGGEDNQGMIFPDDVYTSPQYYTHGSEQYDRESIKVIKAIQGKPDAPVKLYRGVPNNVTAINKGDWVAISRTYAEQHAEGQSTDDQPWHVIEITAPANTVRNGGNDIIEWGYWGADQPAKALRASADFTNECHDPDTGEFCETEGGGTANESNAAKTVVDSFVKKHKKLSTPEGSFDQCKESSEALVKEAKAKGLAAEWVQFMGSKEPMPEAVHQWQDVSPKARIHYVAKIEGTYYDIAARQFWPDAPLPLVAKDYNKKWDKEYDISDALTASSAPTLYEQIIAKRLGRIEPAKLALWQERLNAFYNHAHDEAGRFTTVEGGSSTEAPAPKTTTPAEIRDWARKQGLQVGDRGRLHPDIVAAWKKNQRKLAREQKQTTPTPTKPVQPTPPPAVEPSKPSPDAMREWLRARNYPVSDRGRISQRHKDIYDRANPGEQPIETPKPVKATPGKMDAAITKIQQHIAQLGPPEGWFSFPDSGMEAVDQGWRTLSGEPGDRSKAVASRVEQVGSMIHDEITARLTTKGITEPSPEVRARLTSERSALRDVFLANGDKLDSLRGRMAEDGYVLGREYEKLHPNTTSLYGATDEQQDAFYKEVDKKYPGYYEGKQILTGHGEKIALLDKKIAALDTDYSVAYGNTAREVLNEIRPFGNQKFEKVRGAQIKAVAATGDAYPDQWVTDSNAAGEIEVGTAKRGLHTKSFGRLWIPSSPDDPRAVEKERYGWGYNKEYKNSIIKIAKQPTAHPNKTPYYSNAVHEIGHRFEALRPHIRSVEWVLWHNRAAGQSPESLKRLLPAYNYKADEMAIKDDYVNAYMGKTYGSKSDSNYELFTMGMESLMSGSNPIWKDKQYTHYMLGLLGAG